MRAQELANDLAHQLELVESERDDLKLRLDEAEAVIDAVRKVRRTITTKRRLHYDRWNETDDEEHGAKSAALGDVLDLLNKVDGL